MPASLKRIKVTGGLVLLHVCELCGADASFGVDVNLLLALRALDLKETQKAKRLLGRWYCADHRPQRNSDHA